jgi:hypothetical protein
VRAAPVLAAVAAITATLGISGCGSGGSTTACGPPHHDAFDPRSVTHVLPGDAVPPYLTNPPTSGEHQPVDIRLYRGVLSRPVLPQIQVALLESSQVLVQYRPPAVAGPLATLAHNKLVTVDPDPALPSPVAASAWTWQIRCASETPDALAAVQAFITTHAGNGPQAPPP